MQQYPPNKIPTANGEPAFHLHCITEMQQNPQTKSQLQMVSQPFIYTVWLKCSNIPQTKSQLQMVNQPFIYTLWLKCSNIPQTNSQLQMVNQPFIYTV